MNVEDPLLAELLALSSEELDVALDGLPDSVVQAVLASVLPSSGSLSIPDSPLAQAVDLDEGYRARPHLSYLSERLASAVADVEAGQTRYLRVSMPPRMGKSLLTSVYLPIWLLRKHPDWKLGLISHSPTLAVSWGREVRRTIEEHGKALGIALAKDAGAASEWQTTARGGIVSRSAPGQSITGLGFKVLLIDDAVKDFAAAHSTVQREALWDWWLANASTRLEPPALVVAVGTRWHEDDLLGRFASHEYEGNPDDWEIIEFPAIAEKADVLGRSPGQPLLSPILEEDDDQALERWASVRASVGSYVWAALYQQAPAPAKGAIFDTSWWRYWTTDPAKATEDGTVVHLDPRDHLHARWLDSWDCAFKGTDDSDYVVGQRWLQVGEGRYLMAQTRERRTFTQTLAAMRVWAGCPKPDDLAITSAPAFTTSVRERLVEDKANGTAIIDTLKEEITGLIPVNPTESKQARARAITPEIEAGNVYLPHPGDPGNEWVGDLLAELRDFPTGAHDDQVDALTQALSRMRKSRRGSVTVPGRHASVPAQSRAKTALLHARIPGR